MKPPHRVVCRALGDHLPSRNKGSGPAKHVLPSVVWVSSGSVFVCSPATGESGVRAVLGAFVKALRQAAPALEVRDVPIDHLPVDAGASHPRIAVPLSLT